MIITANLKVTWYEGRLDMDNVRDVAVRVVTGALPVNGVVDINVNNELYVEVNSMVAEVVEVLEALEAEGYDERAEWTSVFENVIIDED